jgi:hypothetical protein
MFAPTQGSDISFHLGQDKVFKLANAHKAKLGLPTTWWDDFAAAKNNWENGYNEWCSPENRTKFVTAKKNVARNNYEPFLTNIIGLLRNNANISDTQLRAADILVEKHLPYPTPTTQEFVHLTVEPSVVRRVIVSFRSQGADSKAKPRGVASMELKWGIFDELPLTVEQLPITNLYSKSPLMLTFEEYQRGEKVYMAARWVMKSTASGYGPWSTITFAIIP